MPAMSKIAALEALLEENPDDPFVIYALAREYEQEAGSMQAALMYEHLVTNYPDYIATYYHYAKFLQEAGNHTEALKLLLKGIERGLEMKELHAVNEMKELLALWSLGKDEEEG